MSNYKILWHTRTTLYYVELQNIMAHKNHVVLCRNVGKLKTPNLHCTMLVEMSYFSFLNL